MAGSVLWTAQGVYFTRNAMAFARAHDAAGGDAAISRAVSLFAGVFAVSFQMVTTLAKSLAGVLLSAFPGARARLYGLLSCTATVCTAAMLLVDGILAAKQSFERPTYSGGCAAARRTRRARAGRSEP